MKQVRALLGILSVVLVLGIGVGFAVGWYISGADADAYRNAPPCQNSQDTSACYVAVPATIGSVHVQYSRSGEYDEVSLVLGGVARAVTLKPSTVSASSVRSGAQGSATLYKGEVMSLEVGSYSIPSDKNPIANHGSYGFYALTLLGLGCLLAGGRYLVPYWGRSRAAESSSTSSALTAGRGIVGNQSVVRGNENLADPGAIQTLITPTGIVLDDHPLQGALHADANAPGPSTDPLSIAIVTFRARPWVTIETG